MQANEVERIQTTLSVLESEVEGLRAIGSLRSVQVLELEISKERRRMRALTQTSPVAAEAFFRLRAVEDRDALARKRLAEQRIENRKATAKSLADRHAAVAELKRVKREIADKEALNA